MYIEPKRDPGAYDREVFLVLKEFEPALSGGGDMPMDFLAPAARVAALERAGESSMKASLAREMPHGYEVGYGLFSINGRVLGHGDPVRVNGTGERVSALVEMTHPGVWTLGDLAGDDRTRGMGIVIEYAGHAGKAGLDSAEAIPLGLHALRKSGCRAAGARRSDRDDDREGQRSR